MTTLSIDRMLYSELHKLTLDQRIRVLDFAKSLPKHRPPGTTGKDLLQFSGKMTPEEANEMIAAIEEQCEQVESDE